MNRLGSEASAYLASAAHQPVHWWAWGEEAFAAARAQDRPVLLDIGAVWCHWCHVMDRESYEDPAVAAWLNEHFVCVKVDRDERPDVDLRYQRAVQAVSGQGGWPLTAVLTPNGDVFWGGTYFPPDERAGRPSFRSALARALEAWTGRREGVLGVAADVRRHVAASLAEGAPGEPSPQLIEAAAERMARAFDFRYGGFGSQPKFPHPAVLEFLLARWWDTGEPWLREVVERTLDGMAAGGMHDQLGGGFHRYSVDARWIVPHFEKMAADNAELLPAYLHGFAALGKSRYREVAEGIVRWALDVLADRERGGFAASQDADVGLADDGDHFTWTEDEARAVLSGPEWEAARRHWDIGPVGEMHHDPRRNVLFVARSAAQVAAELETGEDAVLALLGSAAAKLRAARAQRPAPFVDRAVYVNWNATMAEAFLEAGAILGRTECRDFALRTLERLWSEAWRPETGMGHRVGAAPDAPLLDDQVQAASAFLTAHEHTGHQVWLDRSLAVIRLVLARHRDGAGGCCDVPPAQGESLHAVSAKSIQDAPTRSANAVAALVLLRLAAITGDESLRAVAAETLRAFAGAAADLGVHGATYFRAVDLLLTGAATVAVLDTETSDLASTALATYRPRKVVLRLPSPLTSQLSPPHALLCSGSACSEPVRTGPALRRAMETFGRTG